MLAPKREADKISALAKVREVESCLFLLERKRLLVSIGFWIMFYCIPNRAIGFLFRGELPSSAGESSSVKLLSLTDIFLDLIGLF